jgi:hypothetical protein
MPGLDTLPAESLTQSVQPANAWPVSQLSLNSSTPEHDDDRRPLIQEDGTSVRGSSMQGRAGSSMQGTPSPASLPTCVLQPRTPAEQMESCDAPEEKKRAAEEGLDGASRKHLKVSSARSPWPFGRVADKAPLSR